MASHSSLNPSGFLQECPKTEENCCFGHYHNCLSGAGTCSRPLFAHVKKRRLYNHGEVKSLLPVLHSAGYYMQPSADELAAREGSSCGYCSRVPNFVVGRVGYGHVKFLGNTDVRWMELDNIVKFNRHSVSVYENENDKPPVGHGLNKTAEVTIILQLKSKGSPEMEPDKIVAGLRRTTERQGAQFLSFDWQTGEWKFQVHHFSRFGFDEDEEDDVAMNDAGQPASAQHGSSQTRPIEPALAHSLPAHLGLDPMKMQEMRMVMFPAEDDNEELADSFPSTDRRLYGKEFARADSPSTSGKSPMCISPLQGSLQKTSNKISRSPLGKAPIALLEYNVNNSASSPPSGSILMTGQNKGLPLRSKKPHGFKLEEKHTTPLTGDHSRNMVDAALFMGRSFRVGWGPNGILVHSGTPVGSSDTGLSSIIRIEKVAMDKTTRDEKNKVKEELIDLCFSSPLNLHKSLDRESAEVDTGTFKLKLQKVVCSRVMLSDICRAYIGILEKQLELSSLTRSSRVLLMHQVTVWELIKVLFSERETSVKLKSQSDDDDNEEDMDMIYSKRDVTPQIDHEARPLIRRADFTYWLQDSVCHKVQEEVSYLNDSSDLEHLLILLTGRQLDAAVELASSRGDIRLAILLSQAGGSMINRSDMGRQLDLWRVNGMDFKYIENDRIKLYELLAGNIQGALQDSKVDWKRYLGLVMWYQLPPDTSIQVIVHTYQQLLTEGRATPPVPVYIDEGPLDDLIYWSSGDRYDISYYLMLLHANEDNAFGMLKTMFSAFSSTHDPLDYHMIWHQRAILEAIGAFDSNDLHVLDMSFVSQLLCLGQCHWAIYVVMHMPHHESFPHIHANVVREILMQYCETWSAHEIQRQFIEDLGIPSAWLHEALAVYFLYHGDFPKAMEHFLECSNWQKAHSIFMTSVAHTLFLSAKHSEIWRITSLMEEHKSEIADWDLGAGIYIDFYIIKSSLQDDDAMYDLDPLEKKNEACQNFFIRLNESIFVWGSKLPVDARATYSKMAEELCSLLAEEKFRQESRNLDVTDTPEINSCCFPICDCCSGKVVEKKKPLNSNSSIYGRYQIMADATEILDECGEDDFHLKKMDDCRKAVVWKSNSLYEQNLLSDNSLELGTVRNEAQMNATNSIERDNDVAHLHKSIREEILLTNTDNEHCNNGGCSMQLVADKYAQLDLNDGYEFGPFGMVDRESQDVGATWVEGEDNGLADGLQICSSHEDEYDVFELRIIHRKNRTGFEENKDLPIVLNSVIAGRYYITEYLGSAAFSRVVQAHDLHTGTDVCLKIIKNDKDFFDQSLDEIKLLKYVNKYDPADQCHILRLYDYFYHQEHLFIVCELLRANLYEFQKYNQDSGGEVYFTLPRIQAIAQQCLEALEYLHHLRIIHCDLKPENILIKSYSRCEVKIIDLGSSCFQTDNLCLYVQSRSYRAPEIIIGLPYDEKIDIWSLGCILAELYTGDVLFPNESLVMMLARLIGMLGPIDMEMLKKGQETHKYFTENYDLYHKNEETDQVEYLTPERLSLAHHLQANDSAFLDFLHSLLQINPKRRPTASQALQHRWFSVSYS